MRPGTITNIHLDRRNFLKALGLSTAGVILSSYGFDALGQVAERNAYRTRKLTDDRYDFLMPRVRFACDARVPDAWNAYPGADRNLLEEFKSTVRCKVKIPEGCEGYVPHYGDEHHFNAVVDFEDYDSLRSFPFAFMTAEGQFIFGPRQRDNLKRYLSEGGFLHMDDCCFNASGDFFYQSAFQTLEQTFGPGCVREVPRTHEIFHNVFDLGTLGLPYLQGVNHGARGVFLGDRLVVFLSSTDLHCGWVRAWFTRAQQDQAIQMGINIIMYALSH